MRIDERRYPVADRVTMDQTLLDVGGDPVRPGDVPVVFGPRGPEAGQLPSLIGTIP